MFDRSLHEIRQLPFGADTGGQPPRLATHGDWVAASDSSAARLVAYNARTGEQRSVSLTSTGTFLATSTWGVTWNGDRLLAGDGQSGSPNVLYEFAPGTAPF